MVSDDRADQLAEIAAQLAARIRDDSPADVGRWLALEAPTAEDRWALIFILAAAIPLDRPFGHLVAWARLDREVVEHRRAVLDEARHPRKRVAA